MHPCEPGGVVMEPPIAAGPPRWPAVVPRRPATGPRARERSRRPPASRNGHPHAPTCGRNCPRGGGRRDLGRRRRPLQGQYQRVTPREWGAGVPGDRHWPWTAQPPRAGGGRTLRCCRRRSLARYRGGGGCEVGGARARNCHIRVVLLSQSQLARLK